MNFFGNMNYYRLHFKLVDSDKNLLPSNYHDELLQWVNHFIDTKKHIYSRKLHSSLHENTDQKIRPIRVTNLYIPECENENENIRIKSDSIYLVMVFDKKQILISYLANIFKNQHIRLGNDEDQVYFRIDRVEHLEVKSNANSLALMN